MPFKIGTVTHYFTKLGVAVISLDGDLAVGDRVKFERSGEDLFEQTITALQVGHEKISTASKGMVVTLKTDKHLKEGCEVYKLQ